MRKFYIISCLLLLFNTMAFSQRQRNYIFLFDCTKSMETPNKIWEPAKAFLKTDLKKLDENATVTILLFHQSTSSPIRFRAGDCKWSKIEKSCDEMIEKSQNTGICQAWDLGLKFIDPNRNNYLYLFTDGTENVVKPNGTLALCARISNWCRLTPNNYAFFVALPSKALLESPDIQKIKEATNACDRTFFITSNLGPFGAFDRTNFSQNAHAVRNINVGFSDYGTFPVSVTCSNPYYDVSIKNGKIINGHAVFIVKQKHTPRQATQIHFKVDANPKILNVITKDMFINIDPRDLANLDFAQPSGKEKGQYDAGKAETCSPFLFHQGIPNCSLSVDLGAVFNRQAKKRNAKMFMTLSGIPRGAKVQFAGKEIQNSFELNQANAGEKLIIIVPNELEKGDIEIGLHGSSKNLESINSEMSKLYESSIYFRHVIVMNPLKEGVIWLALSVIVALLLWFSLLRWTFYPRIRVSRIQFQCDEDHYYESKRINSARMVVVGPKKGKQSLLNRWFTGRIVFIASPIWNNIWEMKPKGRKKALRVYSHGKYIVDPIVSEFVQLSEYTLTPQNSKKKIKTKIL